MMWLSHRKTTFNFFMFFLFFKYVLYLNKIKIRSYYFKKRSLFIFFFLQRKCYDNFIKIKLICGASPPFFFYDSYKLRICVGRQPCNYIRKILSLSYTLPLSLFKIQNPDGPLSYALTPPPFTKSLSAN